MHYKKIFSLANSNFLFFFIFSKVLWSILSIVLNVFDMLPQTLQLMPCKTTLPDNDNVDQLAMFLTVSTPSFPIPNLFCQLFLLLYHT